jgi:CCR4-NOT transcription complex subunit 7/8
MGDFPSKASYHYQTVRCNVDLLKMIQLGITLFSTEGELPPVSLDGTSLLGNSRYAQSITVCPCTWTFNFKFDLDEDMSNDESIAILKKAGCDFAKHKEFGVDPLKFGSLLTTSGLVYQPNVTWISFHGGYDFAYIFKQLWNQALPDNEEDFRNLVMVCFPNLYDVKFLLRNAQQRVLTHLINHQRQNNTPSNGQNAHETTPTNPLSNVPAGPPPGLAIASTAIVSHLGSKSGLQDLADELGCTRYGNQHTAGSDAWLTGSVFWAMKNRIFNGNIPLEMNGQMWGLTGVGPPATSAQQAAVLAAQGQQNVINGLGGYHTHGNRDGAPSTPTANSAAIAGTPGRLGGMTPGGGFGNFSYGS